VSFVALLEPLHAEAQRRTGFDDFGDPGYREGLGRLLAAVDDDGVDFADGGAGRVAELITATLVARLYAEEGWKRRPDCLDRPLCRPLVITGFPRSGTTALHRLLALDPAMQAVPRWLALTPMPRPPRSSWPEFAEFRAASGRLRAEDAITPEVAAIHAMAAAEVDECIHLLKQDFSSNFWGSSLPIPSYDAWWRKQDEAPSYVRAADMLRLIGADTPTTPWLLKNPGHIGSLDALLAVMPDAVVVQTHRDPYAALGSLASLLTVLARRNAGGAADPVVRGKRELEVWSAALKRGMAVRDRLAEQGGTAVFIDVRQPDLHADPLRTVRSIYRAAGRELDAGVEHEMSATVAADRAGGAGHQYDPADFGLQRDETDAAFAAYKARYAV